MEDATVHAEAQQQVFVVVEVQAGCAVEAQCFRRLADAQMHAEQARAGLDENDDDVQIFETTIHRAP